MPEAMPIEALAERVPQNSLIARLRARPALKETLRDALERVGFGTTDWVREVMYERCFAYVETLGPRNLHTLEISAGPQWTRRFDFKSYTATEYPDFDICAQTLPQTYDLIIADQVFEHLPWPYRAARNVHAMLKPGGVFIVSTPFLVRIHNVPIDCNRWTPTGMSYFLQEAGFPADGISVDSWGNRACLIGNLPKWRKRGFRSLRNEPNFPVMVWAFARKPRQENAA
ncbi:methyltransferase domain-containing protein [Methylobacterium oxalidis]|uniref:Methyltransferase type 12 n=1 Tax=Methylobacterium oxalidis TaxID=944322 RepID=A0A512IZG9_9HYPH|nr:class I SAM-dependent methyltransferase [Methylobacterium oxalidis]GEP03118.1 hypothetical protein MOX02_11560 [Methylobacterium oxalidis]GJE31721.1 hypothetical protein LDDCCGHA_1901 [Methylobacterium oxalidis]GLS67377.1 hypothetical protein GCM10007888_57610 [Methylobacterium oxalidis]